MDKEEVLKQLGFTEKSNNLWNKSVEGGWAHWDFRKSSKGRFFIAVDGGGFIDDKQAKEYQEYIDFRNAMDQEKLDESFKVDVVEPNINPKENVALRLRGNEEEISIVVKSRRLDMIAKSSKDGKGEGVLYHNLGAKIGFEPSAELVDMICNDMGNIETDVVEHGRRNHIDNDGNIYQTYFAVVKARDKITGTTGLGSAESVMDFDEMDKNKRTFAMTLAIRKAERNAKERLIPVPRKALVELVKELVCQGKEKK